MGVVTAVMMVGDGDAADWYDGAWCGKCVKLTLSSTSLEKMVDIKQEVQNTKSPTTVLFDVDTRRISIITVNTTEYHSDVLERSQG
ncbi:hypothetical protein Tco_0749083 [Tanacetum coccineum]|uniref:Expansin-like EG45 domain-containing protein n=1 Tax=Tanacetum coccineum TaxID=301880 RepID=A0ABQ4Z0F7_9ASTR